MNHLTFNEATISGNWVGDLPSFEASRQFLSSATEIEHLYRVAPATVSTKQKTSSGTEKIGILNVQCQREGVRVFWTGRTPALNSPMASSISSSM
jgi:hypothetical protein